MPLFFLPCFHPGNGFPKAKEVSDAKRPVVKAVPRPGFLSPDHPAVVWTDITVETTIVKGLDNGKHIKAPAETGMGGFVKILGREAFDVPDMGKMDPALAGKFANHGRKIVLRVGAKGAGAEGQTVVDTVMQGQEGPDPFRISDQLRQAVEGPWRVVGVDRHFDPKFFSMGNNGIQEIF